jgi:hypothetical protein
VLHPAKHRVAGTLLLVAEPALGVVVHLLLHGHRDGVVLRALGRHEVHDLDGVGAGVHLVIVRPVRELKVLVLPFVQPRCVGREGDAPGGMADP